VTIFSLLLGLGASLGLWQVYRQARPQHARHLLDYAALALLGALLGGRAWFVGLHWSYYTAHPGEAPAFWQGGFNWAGAVLGGLLAGGLIALLARRSLTWLGDGLAPLLGPVAVGVWLACWTAGVAYGPLMQGALAWLSIPAADEAGQVSQRFPLQPLAAFLLLAWLFGMERRAERLRSRAFHAGLVAALSLLGLGLDLLLASLVWADPTPTWGPLRIDTWCAAALSILSLGAALLLARPSTG
jgi:prolipoprotein diacylglyceryltransferase